MKKDRQIPLFTTTKLATENCETQYYSAGDWQLLVPTIEIGYGQNIQHGQNVPETEKKVQRTSSLSVEIKVSRGGGAEASAGQPRRH
jgi:hypothetical protein